MTGTSDGVSRRSIGASILGPIVVDALVRLEQRLRALAGSDGVALFCARGGLVLQDLLGRIGRRFDRRIAVPARELMVSRIAAARGALLRAPAKVADVIESELKDRSCGDAAIGFAGPEDRRWLQESSVLRNNGWDQSFSVDRFLSLLRRDSFGRRVRDGLEHQAALFTKHLERQAGGAARLILCDTGVFGSTVRYLTAAEATNADWRCLLLVRANYKRLACPHFDLTEGILCECDRYDPRRPESAALMYWPCIEAMLEPDLQSVEWFSQQPDGRVVSNLEHSCDEQGGWQARLVPEADSLRAGVIDYIETQLSDDAAALASKAEAAARIFRRMVVRPTRRDVELLAVGTRSLGFGSAEVATFVAEISDRATTLPERIGRTRRSMWPEGELRRQFPIAATPVLAIAEWSRWARSVIRSVRRTKPSTATRTPDSPLVRMPPR